MRMSRARGIMTGAIVGAAAVGVFNMMDRGTKQKINRYATKSARKVAHIASDLFGK